MSRVTKGSALNDLSLLPGWTIEEDGFGLLTSRLTFITNHGSDTYASPTSKAPVRGDAHPKDVRMTCHRASTTYGSNGLATVVAEYIGISSGNMTSCEVSGRGNMATDPIQTHPKFTSNIGGTKDAPLNGAKFNETTGLFIGFGPTSAPTNKEGVRSYLNPGFGISGHFYTTDIGVAQKMKDALGKYSGDGSWAQINLLGGLGSVNGKTDSIWGDWTTPEEISQLLLTGVAIDFFGTLIKVSYDITYARYGWDQQIYDGG